MPLRAPGFAGIAPDPAGADYILLKRARAGKSGKDGAWLAAARSARGGAAPVDRAGHHSTVVREARLQAGRVIAITPAPVEVEPLLQEAVEAFRLQAEEKQQQLAYAAAAGSSTVLADRDRLLQVLSNLLGNAVKFTPEGGHVQLRAEPGGEGEVQLSVSDTGPGIPAEILPHLFEPFAQAKDTASLGTGLGLAIASGIVEAHGGRLSVESRPGEGTTFRFSLPTPHLHPSSPGEVRAGSLG